MSTARRPGAIGRSVWLVLAVVATSLIGAVRGVDPADPRAGSVELRLPARVHTAPSGTDFARRTVSMTARQRQTAAVAEILRGNVPRFQRQLIEVPFEAVFEDGSHHSASVWVTPDYLSIGGDHDFLRMPLTLPSIATIADATGCLPPTPKLVDAIWQRAHHLKPDPMPPGPQMRSIQYFLRHRQLIERQLAQEPRGALLAGHKKDVVVSNRLLAKPDRIAIYGWHQLNGEAIQPLSTIHGARYADYSHGLRLVAGDMVVDGRTHAIDEVLADPVYSALVSDEGPIRDARTLLRRSQRVR